MGTCFGPGPPSGSPDCSLPSPSCYKLSLHGCLLRDLLVSFTRPPGSQGPESFSCRLGEIQVRHDGVQGRGWSWAGDPVGLG